MPNRLAGETSPYLLQHAENPVDWYPWGEEALDRAKVRDQPIFLSIGYSACHWCHVMAHESFEDEEVAAILNQQFTSIKVDREERPDLDRIYMGAVQALTGSGGWPMSVFLTPDGQPFYGGTYYPPVPVQGRPSFAQVLAAVAGSWRDRREELVAGGQRMVEALEQQVGLGGSGADGDLKRQTVESAFQNLVTHFDRTHGGWDAAPKFPQPMALEFLLSYHHGTGNEQALGMVTQTLDAMARGGLYDQLGGGFHRYSVDDHWLVPHFEKMLYDNAQLARVYLHAWQVTGDPFYRVITEETLDYVVREMTDGVASSNPEGAGGPAADAGGGFYSTQDADSEGEEGKFFVWRPTEIRELLGGEADAFMAAYDVTEQGNFEGHSILELVGDTSQRAELAGARRRLFEAREQRIHPDRDDKVLTSWNGLMLAAFAEAARALNRADYAQIAERNAGFLLGQLRSGEGRLWHTWKARLSSDPDGPAEGAARAEERRGNGEARINGYLEDYAYLVIGLVELYQTSCESRWYRAARDLADAMVEHFGAPDGGFYDTSDDHEKLITRPRELQDNAVPSGSAMAALALLRLAGLTNEPRYTELAHAALGTMQPLMGKHPLAFAQWLTGLDYALARPREIAIIGDPEAPDTRSLLAVCSGAYRPHQIVAAGTQMTAAGAATTNESAVPLLRERGQIDGRPTAYVCVDFACQTPVTDPDDLQALLGHYTVPE